MGDYNDLPSGWVTELEKKCGANPYLELIYDPDGKNISLTGKYSVFDVSSIKNVREIDPIWGSRPSIPEIQICCHDPDDYLNPESTSSPFHNAMGTLFSAHSAGTNVLVLNPDEIEFIAGEELIINDGTNSETVVVQSFTPGAFFHIVYIVGTLANGYAAGTAVYTAGSEYKDMLLRMRIGSETNWVTLFWGKLLRIHHTNGQAIFVVTDRRKLKLDQTLIGADSTTAKKLKWIDTSGSLADSISWNDESAGNLDTGEITVKSPCRLGRWTFTFDSKVTYEVSGPGIEGETGGIAADTVTSISLDSATTSLDSCNDVFVSGDYAYVVSGGAEDSLRIYDISDPTAPVLKSTTSGAGSPYYLSGARAIKVVGDYAYIVSESEAAIVIYDVSDVTAPVRKGYKSGQTNLNGVQSIDVVGDYAYVVSATADNLTIYDISNPNVISEKSSTSGAGAPEYLNGAYDIKVVGNYAYIASQDDGALTIFDISDPSDPSHTGELTLLGSPEGVDVEGNYAYVCGTSSDEIHVIDVTDPSNPSITGTLLDHTDLNGPCCIHVLGDYAYIGCEDGDSVTVVDVSNKANPSICTLLSGADSPNYLEKPKGIHVQGTQIYVACYDDDSFVCLEITALTSSDLDNEQITIPISAWSGDINSGDSVTFCTGINYESQNPVQAIYDFLTGLVTVENKFLDCSSYFGDKEIGTLNDSVDALDTEIEVKVWVPTLIKTGEVLTITEGATTEDVSVTTGVAVTASYPPYITLTVSALANGYTTAAIVTWKQRTNLDGDFSFDREYGYCDDNSITLSLTLEREMSKQQALELLCSHFDGFGFQDNWGREMLHSYRSRPPAAGTVIHNSNLKLPNPEFELRELRNKFRFKYGYDYENEEFLYEMIYPADDDTNRSNLRYGFIREETIELPGVFSDSIIDLIKVNKYEMWENGINIVRFSMTLQGLITMIGDHIDLTSLYPSLSTRIEVLGVEAMQVTGNLDIQLIGWDYKKIFGSVSSSSSSVSSSSSSYSSSSNSSSSSSYSSSSSSYSSSSHSQSSSSSSQSSSSYSSSSYSSVSLSSSSLSLSSCSSSSSSYSSSSSSSLSVYDIGTTIFKLAWGARTINFSDQEVDTVEIVTNKALDLERLQNRSPIIYELGESYKTITVTLLPSATKMSLTKLEALRKITSIMTLTMYYSNGVTQAEQFSVRIDPTAKSFYHSGYQDAGTGLVMVFYEAEDP